MGPQKLNFFTNAHDILDPDISYDSPARLVEHVLHAIDWGLPSRFERDKPDHRLIVQQQETGVPAPHFDLLNQERPRIFRGEQSFQTILRVELSLRQGERGHKREASEINLRNYKAVYEKKKRLRLSV